jgi:hypothetical protein
VTWSESTPSSKSDSVVSVNVTSTTCAIHCGFGHRITCVGVAPAVYPAAKYRPRFDTWDTVAVVPATEADWLAESERQSTGRT